MSARAMDIATVIGIVVSASLVASAIFLGGEPVMFLNLPSMLIVVGGTLGATLVRNPLSAVANTVTIVRKAFSTKVPDPSELIDEVTALSKKARQGGLLVLEKVPIEYEFLSKGVALCVDGLELEQVKTILENDIRATASRHKRGQRILESMGEAAPAFGMIGTLIGLVQMLAALDDPSAIGPGMALALLTTLYGSLLANVLCLPLADKLKYRSEEELLSMLVCLEGIIGIAQGDNPASIGYRMKAFLPPKVREPEAKAA